MFLCLKKEKQLISCLCGILFIAAGSKWKCLHFSIKARFKFSKKFNKRFRHRFTKFHKRKNLCK